MELERKVRKEKLRRDKLVKYKEDFQLFSEENIRILPKESSKGFIPFMMNEAQQLIHEKVEEQRKATGMVRVIILKARQQGISTYCAARSYWRTSLTPNVSTVVVAHLATASTNLFNMTRNMIFNHPEDTRPQLSKASQNIIKFDGSESSYHVYTAGSPEAGRGSTPTIAHLSEVAFWQYDDKILAGLFQGIADAKGTEIILESTANGASGEFYNLWQGAVDGTNGFTPIFIPWHMTSEYFTAEDAMPEDFEPTDEELELGLTDQQLNWRRVRIARMGEDKFNQEYPSHAHQAFLQSGSNVFNVNKLLEQVVSKPLLRKNYYPERLSFDESPEGMLEIYQYPQIKGGYVLGCDVSLGVGGSADYSAIVVMDKASRVVAMYRDNEVDPATFGDVIYALGRYYNNGLAVVESNTYGEGSIRQLVSRNYTNLYHSSRVRQTELKPGFATTVKTKPAIIAQLQRAILDDSVALTSNRVIHECLSFVQKENGKMQAGGEGKDDTVMATALCLEAIRTHLHKMMDSDPFGGYKDQPPDDTEWF